jgi:hypothetical protein
MRATDLKPTRKVSNGNGIATATHNDVVAPAAIPAYLRRYESERDAWLASRPAR